MKQTTTTDMPSRELRNALGLYTTGVAVVTCAGPGGHRCGVTVNSFASVSLDPPLVLWSLQRSSPSLETFEQAGHFAVNVLAQDQQDVSDRFARPAIDKFDGLVCSGGLNGVPLLPACLARFECRTEACHEGGDHVIFVGRVLRWTATPGAPLVFHGGRYDRLAGHRAALDRSAKATACAACTA